MRPAFDALVHGTATPAEFSERLVQICRERQECTWEALALFDQYFRRGELDAREWRPLKQQIERAACGGPALAKAPRQISERVLPERAPASGSLSAAGRGAATRVRPQAVLGEGALAATAAPPAEPDPLSIDPVSIPVESRPEPRPSFEARSEARAAPAPPAGTKYAAVGMVLRGRYVLEEILGHGGMGTVFLALDRNREHHESDDRHVAIKVLRPELAERPEALDTLRREFHQAQRLSHPGIVNVFDLDHDGAIYFITMEMLRGTLLNELIGRAHEGRLPRVEALRILRDLGNAVVHAHDREVLHADLKPGNVMITERGELRVLDFGVALPLIREPWISDPGQAFQAATPTYSSCERLMGDSPDVRDDVFGFACLAYELLSGKHPFDRLSALQARAEQRLPRRIPGLSQAEWRTLRKALAFDRQDRLRTLRTLLDAFGLDEVEGKVATPHELLQMRREPPVGYGGRWYLAAAVALVGVLGIGRWLLDEDVMRSLRANEQRTYANVVADLEDADAGIEGVVRSARNGVTRLVDSIAALAVAPAGSPASSSTSTATGVLGDEQAGANAGGGEVMTPAASLASTGGLVPAVPGTDESGAAGVDGGPADIASGATAAGPARMNFTADTFTANEAAGIAKLTVRRRGDLAQRVSFSWRASDGSAVAGADYAQLGIQTETFAPGQAYLTILVPLVGDGLREDTEAFGVDLVGESGQLEPGGQAKSLVLVLDDD